MSVAVRKGEWTQTLAHWGLFYLRIYHAPSSSRLAAPGLYVRYRPLNNLLIEILGGGVWIRGWRVQVVVNPWWTCWTKATPRRCVCDLCMPGTGPSWCDACRWRKWVTGA